MRALQFFKNLPLNYTFRQLIIAFICIEVIEIMLRIFFTPQPISLLVPGMLLVLYFNLVQRAFTDVLVSFLVLPPLLLYCLYFASIVSVMPATNFRIIFVVIYVLYTCWIVIFVFIKIPFSKIPTHHQSILIKQIALLVFMLMLIRLFLIYLDGIGFRSALLNQPNLLRITFIIALIAIKVIYIFDSPPETIKAADSCVANEKVEFITRRLQQLFDEEKFFLTKRITKDKMAQALGCSKKEFKDFVDNHLEGGIKHYVAKHRINYALDLFACKGDIHTIEAIALESGFSSVQTFNKYFYSFVGQTPSTYLNKDKK